MKNEAGSSINLGIIPGNHARNDANNEGRIDHHIQKPCMLKEKIHIYIYIYAHTHTTHWYTIHQRWYGLS